MHCYWGSELRRKRRDELKRGRPLKEWDQRCGTEVCQIYGGESKYLLGEDVWVVDDGNEGGNEDWLLSLEEVVCDHNYADLDSKTILLQNLGFIKAE